MKTSTTHRPIQPGPGARCLYLGGHEHKRVSCTAEALVVTNASAQTLRYPVARVARIVSNAEAVDWSGPALALCLRAGIGITWVDKQGQVTGSAYTQTRKTTSFTTALELWIERPDGVERYQNWLKRRRMDILMRWRNSQQTTVSPQRWETVKREWVYLKTFTVHLPQALRSLCLAFVAAQLNGYALPPRLWGPRIENINLDEDLCELLWAEMNLAAGTLTEKVDEDATLTAIFERWCARNASALTVHLADLHRTALKEMYE